MSYNSDPTLIRDDYWLNFDMTIFEQLVDPNDVLPVGVEVFLDENDQVHEKTIGHRDEKMTVSQVQQIPLVREGGPPLMEKQISNQGNIFNYQLQHVHTMQEAQIQPSKPVSTNQIYDFNQFQQNHPKVANSSNYSSSASSSTASEVSKTTIQQKLDDQKNLSKRRQQKLKAELDMQPFQASRVLKSSSGKKLTGRERQMELERQEARQLELKEHHLNLIEQLENKCKKLREILENIVANSPEYNSELLHFLESSDLLIDKSRLVN